MAGFVTANRWATGVETHKTSEGRILCTGVGCVGCFPEVFETEASELGVCDVDLAGNIFGLRPFLDEENSREKLKLNAKRFSRRKKGTKSKQNRHKGTVDKERTSFEVDIVKSQESHAEKSEEPQPSGEPKISSVATQTELSEMGIGAQPVLWEIINDASKHDLLTFEEESKPDNEGIRVDNLRQSSANYNIVEIDDNINKTHKNWSLFDQPSSGSKFEKIHDKMYIVSTKDIALSSFDNITREDDVFEHTKNGASVTKQRLSSRQSRGEDSVCFFFALEYYNSQRILPSFRVMEIVEALSTVVDLKDIKCVQRISRRWHIVLKSRKYIGLLRNCGLKLRGRAYQLVDDVDSYFDIVQ